MKIKKKKRYYSNIIINVNEYEWIWDINEKKKDVLIWIYEYWIWFHRYSPPSLFSPSFSHIWWDTLSRRDHFRKQFVATLDSDGWACPIDLPVTRSTACLLGCLKPEGEGLEELREWFGWKEIECSGETVFSLLCETSGNLVGKKS